MWESEEYLLHYNRSFSERLERNMKVYSESFFRKCYAQSKNLTSPLLKLKKILTKEEQIQILDIGGGGGDNYPRLKKFFNDITLHYVILDSKAIWDSSWNVRKRMMIENDLVEHLLDLKSDLEVDLVVSIGTISFIPNFNLKLDIVEKGASPKYIYVDRTFFQIKGKKFTQIAKLQSSVNEWNIEVEHFSHNRKELINTFRLQGYSLVSRGLAYPWIIKKKKVKALGFYQELLFAKVK
jgi:putative methyltransferase (TIGR04325 family)